MEEFKGTPGQWWVEDEEFSTGGEDAVITCDFRDGMVEICRVDQGGSQRDESSDFANEQRANAQLIAAAPELLEALQACLPILENHKLDASEASSLLDCRAAIAKALGKE